MTHRAYSFLTVEKADDERREISGWASRPEPDRVGDIVEPMGMAPPRGVTPLLLDHRHADAIGTVIDLKPEREGVRFRAKIAKIAQDGPLKRLCDDAWAMVKSGLRAATSIGFRPLETEPLREGGLRFKKWELLELSLVAVPAAPGATIDTIKNHDRQLLRKLNPTRVVRLDRPVSTAVLAAIDTKSAPVKGVCSTDAMMVRTIAAIAHTTDECIGQLDERISRLEQRSDKSVVDMSHDEFVAYMAAQKKRLGIAS